MFRNVKFKMIFAILFIGFSVLSNLIPNHALADIDCTAFNVLPYDSLPGTNCLQRGGNNTTTSTSPTCTLNNIMFQPNNYSNIDPISQTMLNYYTQGDGQIVLFELGTPGTEGVYVTCTSDFASCVQNSCYGNQSQGNCFTTTSDYSAASANKNMVATYTQGGGQVSFQIPGCPTGTYYYCPLTRCDVQTTDLQGYVSYNGENLPFLVNSINAIHQEQDLGNGTILRAISLQNQVCLALKLPQAYYYVGCKDTVLGNNLPQPSCWGSAACSSAGMNHSLFFISITGRLVECVKGTIEYIFNNGNTTCSNASTDANFLTNLQNGLRPAVMAAILLYAILFGINLVLSNELIPKGQVFGFVMKIIAVIYFSVGFPSNNCPSGQTSCNQNGINQYVFNGFYAIMSSFSNFMISTSEGNLCNFAQFTTPTNQYYQKVVYSNGNSGYEDFSFLALWDSLDCRLIYYFGLSQLASNIGNANNIEQQWKTQIENQIQNLPGGGIINSTVSQAGAVVSQTGANILLSIGIFELILLSLVSFEITFLIFTILFSVFLLSIAVYFVRLFVMAMVALAIMSYLAVIFVPMVLFEQTKTYFMQWLALLFSFSLQPVVVAGFLVLLMGIFDTIIFNGCGTCWQSYQFNFEVPGLSSWSINSYMWGMDYDSGTGTLNSCDNTTDAANCMQSFGYLLTSPTLPKSSSLPLLFMNLPILASNVVSTMFPALLEVVFFCFMFYFFAKTIGDFAGQITGGIKISAGDPMEVFDKFMKAVTKGATTTKQEKKGGDGEGEGNSGMKGARGGVGGGMKGGGGK